MNPVIALQRLGVKKALVVHSSGLDELTPMGPADVVEVTQQGEWKVMRYRATSLLQV